MTIRRGAVVVAIAAGAALAVSGTTNASTENECDTASTSVQSWSGSECSDYEFARSDDEKDWDHDKGHGDKDHDKGHHHDKDHDKGHHHDKDHGHKHHDKDHKHHKHHKHHGHKHHKHQVHKKPHGGVETGDGSLAALL